MKTLTTLSSRRFGAAAAMAFAMKVVFAFGNTAHANDNFWCNVEYNWTGGGDCAPANRLLAELDIDFITPAQAGDQLKRGWDCFAGRMGGGSEAEYFECIEPNL